MTPRKVAPPLVVYELHRAFYSKFTGQWYPTVGSSGILYSTLAAAQARVTNASPWCKRSRKRQWETDRQDIITERKVTR